MITWVWIEGWKALEEFCLHRFKERPRFIETCGKVGPAKIRLIYKHDEQAQEYREMYLLYMDAPIGMEKGNVAGSGQFFDEIQRMTYEKIRADKTAIVKQ